MVVSSAGAEGLDAACAMLSALFSVGDEAFVGEIPFRDCNLELAGTAPSYGSDGLRGVNSDDMDRSSAL